jgi:hypothetical protein
MTAMTKLNWARWNSLPELSLLNGRIWVRLEAYRGLHLIDCCDGKSSPSLRPAVIHYPIFKLTWVTEGPGKLDQILGVSRENSCQKPMVATYLYWSLLTLATSFMKIFVPWPYIHRLNSNNVSGKRQPIIFPQTGQEPSRLQKKSAWNFAKKLMDTISLLRIKYIFMYHLAPLQEASVRSAAPAECNN